MKKEETKEKSFEENLEELGTIVGKLEAGDIPLDDAISEFEHAMRLAKICDEKLKKADEAIQKLVEDDGTLKAFEIKE